MAGMDAYSAATSWILFGGVVAFGCWYYYPQQHRKPAPRNVDDSQHANVTRRKKHEQEERGRPSNRPANDPGNGSDTANGSVRKRKAPESAPIAAATTVAAKATEPEEDELSTRRWAEGMMLAQKGHDIGSSSKSKESRVKTVKQSNARDSSQGGAEADDDMSPVRPTGDVSDMLEPASKGLSSLRVTAPTKSQKEKTPRQPKEEVVETKKQRQNRMKAEERRLARAAEETDRKKLEESQRRTAREALGEPARNGIPVSKPPAVSAWVSPISSNDSTTANRISNAPLLDTFDADSVSSSNGGAAPSTGPTSTSSAQWEHDLPSEEDQMAQAMKQSEDESGWTTVSTQQKKSKKKSDAPVVVESVAVGSKTKLPQKTPATNGKPIGFQALEVQYEQRSDADPNDALNWDA